MKGTKFYGGYPIGEIVITSSNNAPEYPGTWELVDWDFSPISTTDPTDYVTINDTNTTAIGSFIFIRSNKMITIRMRITNKVAISDTTLVFATLNKTALGLSSMFQFYTTGYTDTGNAMVEFAVTSNGEIESLDVIPKTDDGTVPAGSTIDLYFIYGCTPTQMNHSARGKYYWQRTA